MTKVTIWHNPRCSKSRETLALHLAQGAEITERRYLDDAPSQDDIRQALALLNLPAIKLMRTQENDFKALGLKKTDDEATLIAAMAGTPKLIERPVVFANGKAALGRPPETVLTIL